LFDGTTWTTITGVSVPIAITGIATTKLSHVWSYASRLFFIEKGTLNAWYLPVDSLGGAALSFSLAGVFKLGGSLLFGGTWSLDAGDGLDDKWFVVSTEGEVAVYTGVNPSSAADWTKQGVYQITKPMGFKGVMQAGGDLLIATESGLLPLSEAVQKDVAALSMSALSAVIKPRWDALVAERRGTPWEILKWASNSMLIVSLPRTSGQKTLCFAANLETGKWAEFTGWDTRCMAFFGGRGFFGTTTGEINEMDTSGSDNGVPYTCTYVGQFEYIAGGAMVKTMHQAKATFIAGGPFLPKISASADYNILLPTPPNSGQNYISSEWGTAIWGTSKWGGNTLTYNTTTRWVSIGKTGFVIAPQMQVTVGISPTPKIELVSIDATYTMGGAVV
jgi:hypothetical protein